MQDDLWCSSNLNLLLLLSSPSSCMCSSHPAQALGWPRFLIVERSQILASSLILPPSGATHPPTPKAKYGSNLPRERTLFRSRTLQAARGNSRFSRLPITSAETGEREKIEEKLRDEDERVGKESLSGFRGFIPTLLK